MAANNGKAEDGGKGSLAVLMNQSDNGRVILGGDSDGESLMIIRYMDESTGRLRFKIGVCGNACDVVDIQDGLSLGTEYRLDDCHCFVPYVSKD